MELQDEQELKNTKVFFKSNIQAKLIYENSSEWQNVWFHFWKPECLWSARKIYICSHDE